MDIPFIRLAILAGTVNSFLELWLIIGMFVAYEYYRRYQDQIVSIANTEKELSDARLTAFRMQLQPHFLFNALNEELEFIRCYLDIESIRFSDRLAINYQISADLGNALVPNLIL